MGGASAAAGLLRRSNTLAPGEGAQPGSHTLASASGLRNSQTLASASVLRKTAAGEKRECAAVNHLEQTRRRQVRRSNGRPAPLTVDKQVGAGTAESESARR